MKMKAAVKRAHRKSLLLLFRAIAGSSARSAVKAESGKLRLSERNASLLASCTASVSRFNHASRG